MQPYYSDRSRRRPVHALRSAFMLCVAVAAGCVTFSAAYAEPIDAEAIRLGQALFERVVVWRKPNGEAVPISHCRRSSRTGGGCNVRMQVLASLLVRRAREHGLDPWLLAGMAVQESGLNPMAVGKAGELGILQIHPKSRAGVRLRFMRDIAYRERCRYMPDACQDEIISRAAAALANSYERCGGDRGRALRRYNSGRCDGTTAYPEYVEKTRKWLLEHARLGTPHGDS